jgi:hypothetical protein
LRRNEKIEASSGGLPSLVEVIDLDIAVIDIHDAAHVVEAAVDDLADLPAFFDPPGKRGFRAQDEESFLDVLAQNGDVKLFPPFRVALFFTFSEDKRRPTGEPRATRSAAITERSVEFATAVITVLVRDLLVGMRVFDAFEFHRVRIEIRPDCLNLGSDVVPRDVLQKVVDVVAEDGEANR